MKIQKYLPVVFSLIVLSSCTEDSPLISENEQIVVQAYLYANESIRQIRLTSTLPLDVIDTNAPPINTAEVGLIKADIRYALDLSPGDSGYYHYDGDDLTVEVGDYFEIYVDHFNQTASGTTTVPPAPSNVTKSSSTLYVPEFTDPQDFMNFEFDSTRHQITIEWDAVDNALFYVSVENTEANPDSIETSGFRPGGMGRFFISAPTSSSEYSISMMNVDCYGQHDVRVYRVNQEYADLYISRQQDSRDLNEPCILNTGGRPTVKCISDASCVTHACNKRSIFTVAIF